MPLTIEKRIKEALTPFGVSEAGVKAATQAAMLDITLLWTITDKTVTLLGTYPEKPGAKEIYDAADLARKQYDPRTK